MPTLEKKKQIVEEIIDNLENSLALYVTNYSGLSVPEINELRSEFAEDGLTFRVYKNTLIQRAMEEVGGYDDLYPHLHNQNAFAFADEALAKPAKILKKFNEDHEKPEFKAALIDGGYYGPDQLGELAAMKSKEEVIGEIVSLLQAPVSNVVSALKAQGENLAGAVESIAEKGGEIGKAETEEADAGTADQEAEADEEEAAAAEKDTAESEADTDVETEEEAANEEQEEQDAGEDAKAEAEETEEATAEEEDDSEAETSEEDTEADAEEETSEEDQDEEDEEEDKDKD